jgi:choice-of-anchor B domain-containing protein
LRIIFGLALLLTTSNISAQPYGTEYTCDHLKSIKKSIGDSRLTAHELSNVAIDTSFEIEAVWVGTPQWMSGVNNGYETFNGSISRGHNFFGSSLLPSQFVPVEIRFNSDSTQWSNVQVFKRYGYDSAGVGTFPGSAWDVSDAANPRRLNLNIVECYTCSEHISGPANGRWDPDTSVNGKFEYLFVMLSDYDSTGTYYADSNILQDEVDNLYAWWPRVASGHTFFETDTAKLIITPSIGLNLYAFDTSISISWIYPGPDPNHFRLYYSVDSLNWALLAELWGYDTSFVHSGLPVNQKYYYQIMSFDASDNLIYTSRIKSAKTREITISLSFFGQWNQRNNYGGLWGYTDEATGMEYALLCCRSQGLSIIDITNSTPVEVGFVSRTITGVGTQEVRTHGNYAVTVQDGYPTGIIDISDVTDPQVIATIPNGQHTLQIYKDYVFLAGGAGGNGLEIFSITDPANPSFVAGYHPYYYHDFAIRNDTLAAFGIYGDGIDIFDITNIFNPIPISHFNYLNSGPHNGVFSNDGRYLFVGDEIGNGKWTRVFDLIDLDNVQQVSEIVIDPFAVVHNCELRGDHLYIAHYIHGLRIWNVADPTDPYEVAFYDTHPQPSSGYAGAWSPYPFFASGKVIVSDMSNGLFVFNTELLGNSCCDGIRGDCNGDGSAGADVLDLTFLINSMYRGGPDPLCEIEADLNGDGVSANVLDLTYMVNDIFRGGPDAQSCP